MRQTGLDRLETELRGSPPAGLAALSQADLHDLAEAVQDARSRQATALAAAGDNALRHIPRLLRGPVKKVVGA